MELLDVPQASLDALQRVYRPTDYPTREEIEDTRSSGIVWLYLCQRLTRSLRQSERQEEYDAATSALEALARLRLLKYGEWLAVVEELWPKPIKILRQLRLLEREVKLGVRYCPSRHWRYIRSYDHFLRPCTLDPGTSDSDEDKSLGCAHASDLAIPVHLVLSSMNYAGRTWHWELWMKACEAVETAHERLCCGFALLYRFVSMEIDLASDFHEWADSDLWTVFRRFAACGVRVMRQFKPRSTWILQDDMPRLVPLVQDLMATNSPQHQGLEGFSALEGIRVWLLAGAQFLDSVFSAIIASRSVRQVTMANGYVGVGEDRERALQWVAIVFRHAIQDIDLDCGSFKMDDVHVLENALRVPNPLSLLFPSTLIPVDQTESAFVASARRFHLHPPSFGSITSDINQSTLLYDSSLENLPVISIDEEWVTVLLPGWGRAWVSHVDVSLASTEQPLGRTGRGPRRLSLTNLQSDQAPVILALLRQVGGQVQAISLSSWPGYQLSKDRFKDTTPFLESVVLACPNLEELTIKTMSLPSLSIFTRAYENYPLRVQRLFLEKVEVDDRADSLYFFKTLADPRHPMTSQLRSFSCTLRNRDGYFPNIKPTLLHMLQHNKHLDEFQLDPGDAKSASGPDDTIRQEELDPINVGQLSARSILAFLSAVDAQRRVSKTSKTNHESVTHPRCAMQLLDQDVLTTIFQFASSVRFVRVECWP